MKKINFEAMDRPDEAGTTNRPIMASKPEQPSCGGISELFRWGWNVKLLAQSRKNINVQMWSSN